MRTMRKRTQIVAVILLKWTAVVADPAHGRGYKLEGKWECTAPDMVEQDTIIQQGSHVSATYHGSSGRQRYAGTWEGTIRGDLIVATVKDSNGTSPLKMQILAGGKEIKTVDMAPGVPQQTCLRR